MLKALQVDAIDLEQYHCCSRDESSPRDVYYIPGVLGESEEAALVAASAQQPWVQLRDRRLQCHGGTVLSEGTVAEPLPPHLQHLCTALQGAGIFDAARPHLVAGVLRGVMIGDELTAQGLPFASLELLIDEIAAAMAGVPATSRTIYYNDSIFAATWPRIPHNLTLFSLDYYHGPATGRIGRTVMDLYDEYVLPKLGPNTKALFVPQAFGSDVGAVSLEQYEEYALAQPT